MDRSRLGVVKRVVVGLGVALGLTAAMSCSDPDTRTRRCDYTVTRCQTVCNYWCDYYWGCYPRCWDQCWNDCYVNPTPPPTAAPPASTPDAAPPPPAADGGGEGGGDGVLCSACTTNEDCSPGAFCIVRGGTADAGADGGTGSRSFCGRACAGASDCPEGFVCTQIGPNRQCVPQSGACP